jgi:hypothetical protein
MLINARHEAAHSVVAVRLGLPLLQTDIKRRTFPLGDGRLGLSHGFTEVDPAETAHRQSDPTYLMARATFAAAGAAAEHLSGTPVGHVAYANDVDAVVGSAKALGVSDDDLPTFIIDRANEAIDLLHVDDGVAWDRVAIALQRKRVLTGDEVRKIVAAVKAASIA